MKTVRFLSLLCSLLVLMPQVLTSIIRLSDMGSAYELSEKALEGNQGKGMEYEKKESKDGSTDLQFCTPSSLISWVRLEDPFDIHNNGLAWNSSHVLTPPPEFVRGFSFCT